MRDNFFISLVNSEMPIYLQKIPKKKVELAEERKTINKSRKRTRKDKGGGDMIMINIYYVHV